MTNNAAGAAGSISATSGAAGFRPAGAHGGAITAGNPLVVLDRFISQLRERHQRGVGGEDEGLILADAAIRECEAPYSPPFALVFGPTQVGKSSIVNMLLGVEAAGVNPLAGYTVHAQGFCTVDVQEVRERAAHTLPSRRLTARADLQRECFDEYSLEQVRSTSDAPPCVLWDSPDFDSLAAWKYRSATLELAAAADLLILVVSKEKYSDLRVWDLLRRLDPLERPLIVCVNKTDAESADMIVSSLRTRLAEFMPRSPNVPIIAVPFVEGGLSLNAPSAAIDELRDIVRRALVSASVESAAERSAGRGRAATALIEANWSNWTEPLAAESAALDTWNAEIDAAAQLVAESFAGGYLDHPQRYDAFRRATIELIRMIEWPGIGDVLGRVRSVITWPARRLIAVGRALVHGEPITIVSNDRSALTEGVSRSLTRLQRDLARRLDPAQAAYAVWRGLHERIDARRAEIEQHLSAEIDSLLKRLDGEIQSAARELHERLREDPARLNALRATRTVTDVASVVIAIKTGGAPIHDLLLAPALLAVSSMLTEGALGAYVGGVADRLKRRLSQRVRSEFIDTTFVAAVRAISNDLTENGVIVISREQVAAARAALNALQPGGRASA